MARPKQGHILLRRAVFDPLCKTMSCMHSGAVSRNNAVVGSCIHDLDRRSAKGNCVVGSRFRVSIDVSGGDRR